MKNFRRAPVRRSRRFCWSRAGLLTVVVVLAGAQPAAGAPGDLDTTFNGTGKVLAEKGPLTAAALQARGANANKIVVGTSSGLVRFTTSGAIDTSFAQAGTASSPQVFDLAVQSNDSLVTVHWWAAEGLTVRRFTADGKPDTTFDGDGSVTVRVPGFPAGTARAVAMAPGGKIIVAGAAWRSTPACVGYFGYACAGAGNAVVARLLPSGAIDKAFGVDGIAFLGGYAGRASTVDLAIRLDGSVAVVGNISGIGTPNGWDTTTVVSLLRPDGRPDLTFGRAGEVTSGPMESASVQFDLSGRILVAGTGYDYFSDRYGSNLARFLPSGAVDARFGTMGVAKWAQSCPDFYCSGAASVVVVPPSHPGGGRLIVAGWKSVNSYQHLAAVAFEYETGRLDLRFGNGGSVVPGPEVSRAEAATLTPDGKLLLAGRRYEEEILLYRYHLQ